MSTAQAEPGWEFLEEGEGPEEGPRSTVMSDDDLKSLIAQELQDTSAIMNGGTLAEERERAINYYYARPFGNEVEGKSQIVLADTAETIDWIMPSLIRMFTGSRELVAYEPVNKGDEAGADQSTDVVNLKFERQLNGFVILHTLFKVSLGEKVAPGYVQMKEVHKLTVDTYEDQTEIQLQQILETPGVTPIEHSERVVAMKQLVPGEQGMEEVDVPVTLHTIKVKTLRTFKKLDVGAIPPEEFFITRRYADIDDETPFCGRRFQRSVSSLIASGLPAALVESLHSDDPTDTDSTRLARYQDEDGGNGPTDLTRTDSGRRVWVTECYIRVDQDGDGIAELRRVLLGGDGESGIILENDYADDGEIPYFHLCPYPMPFKFWGRSLADIVAPLQLIRSTIMRMILDYLYLTVNPQKVVREGAIDMESLLTARAGGNIIAYDNVEDVKPLEQPSMPPAVFSVFEMLQGERENRAGVTRYNQGLDAASLNQTARGLSQIMEAASARVELIARCFVPGLSRMFKLILKTLKRHGMAEEAMRLRDQWVDVDPASWNVDMDVVVKVGLGVGQARERIESLLKIIEMQMAAAEKLGPQLVTPQHGFAALQELCEAMGFPIDEKFFRNPGNEPPPPPAPDPRMLDAETKAKAAEANIKANVGKLKIDATKAETDLQFKQYECQKKTEIDLARIASNERIEFAKIQSAEKIATEQAEATRAAAKEAANAPPAAA